MFARLELLFYLKKIQTSGNKHLLFRPINFFVLIDNQKIDEYRL